MGVEGQPPPKRPDTPATPPGQLASWSLSARPILCVFHVAPPGASGSTAAQLPRGESTPEQTLIGFPHFSFSFSPSHCASRDHLPINNLHQRPGLRAHLLCGQRKSRRVVWHPLTRKLGQEHNLMPADSVSSSTGPALGRTPCLV